jgi:hypothetical protein
MAASFSGEGCGVIESAPMRLRKPYGALWKARVCFVGNKSLQNNVGAVKRQWRRHRAGPSLITCIGNFRKKTGRASAESRTGRRTRPAARQEGYPLIGEHLQPAPYRLSFRRSVRVSYRIASSKKARPRETEYRSSSVNLVAHGSRACGRAGRTTERHESSQDD